MKQVVQSLRTGAIELLDVPAPRVAPGHVLVQSRASVISAGTERSLVEFGRASLLAKVRENPDRVRQVLDKVKTDGLWPTLEAVFARLDEPFALGYCHAGEVIEVASHERTLAVGDRVATNGPHASLVHQAANLLAPIPENVSYEQAAFTPLAAIALAGIRLIAPQLGETVAVFGLGLVGLLAVQILAAQGCRVLAIDLDAARLELARQFGALAIQAGDDGQVVAAGLANSGGIGVDAVLIAASAKEDTIISQAAQMSRKRGRIVLVGVVNTQLNRTEFYAKELTFQVSCSYGPGRHDEQYEQQGIDYPLPFVRWTARRNFEAVLDLMARGKLDVAPLISSRVPHTEAARAYELLTSDKSQLGIVFVYPEADADRRRKVDVKSSAPATSVAAGKIAVGVIGAGDFTRRTLLPLLKRTPATPRTIASAGGLTAADAARRFGFSASTTDHTSVLEDPTIDVVFITTRHHQHAPMAAAALRSGKHVFVEKPLAIDAEGLADVRRAFSQATNRQLMVGFNRRFSPHAVRMRQVLAARSEPACIVATVNAGAIPANHWIHDPTVGGGRLIGEGCHWIDLFRFLLDTPIVAVQTTTASGVPVASTLNDLASVSLQFADGSQGTLHYFANGHPSFPKERIEVFCGGRVLALDNFRVLRGYGWKGFSRNRLWRQDKGHRHEIELFINRIAEGGPPLIPPEELWNVTAASLAAEESARTGERVTLTQE